jgi:hypothetical protein
MKAKKPKRPKDPMELAKLVGDMATGEIPRDDESLRKANSPKPKQSSLTPKKSS